MFLEISVTLDDINVYITSTGKALSYFSLCQALIEQIGDRKSRPIHF